MNQKLKIWFKFISWGIISGFFLSQLRSAIIDSDLNKLLISIPFVALSIFFCILNYEEYRKLKWSQKSEEL